MPIPPELDWDLWLGPAPARPFNTVYFPGPKWYRWWDFGNACAGAPQAAAHFIERARRIADSFELGIAGRQGRIVRPRFSSVERQSVRPSAPEVSCG